MPLVRISLRRGRPATELRAIGDAVHRALVETFSVPADDRFQLVHQHEPEEFAFDPAYLGHRRSDRLVMIEITAGGWRDADAKRALYRRIADGLAADPGLDPDDVLVVLSPNDRADWSFGAGRASYLPDPDVRP